MRVIFLYVSDGAASTPEHNIKYEHQDCTNRFASLLFEDGLTYTMQKLLECSVINELLIVIESTRGPGKRRINANTELLVAPHVNDLIPQLREDDIIFARGGFRSWFTFLNLCKDRGNWLMLYAANTGREKWLFWDVVFDDLKGETFWSKDRLHLEYRKPVKPDIFFPSSASLKYDLMIGASHIHDKKGQWKVINALVVYKRKYGINLKCILPGAARRGVMSNNIPNIIKAYDLDVERVSMLPRIELAKKMNQSRIFVHAGAGGQNDRGPLEAMRCGCYILLATPSRHSPTIYQNKKISTIIPYPDDSISFAEVLHDKINNEVQHKGVSFDYYEEVNGFGSVTLPAFIKLFDVFRYNPKRNTQALKDAYRQC